MSLLSRDRLVVVVGQTEISMLRKRGALRRSTADFERYPVGDPCEPGAVCGQLADLLQDSRWADIPTAVVIDDAYFRFAVVPDIGKRLSQVAKEAHARFLLAEQYGPEAERWQIAIEQCPPGESYLVSGAAPELINGLQTIHADNQHIESIQPLMIAMWNRLPRLKREPCWLATYSNAWITVALIRAQKIVSIETRRAPTGPLAELRRIISLAQLAEGASVPGICHLIGEEAVQSHIAEVRIESLPDVPVGQRPAEAIAEVLCA